MWKEYKEKEHNQHSSVIKVLRQLSNFSGSLIIPIILIFLSCWEKAHNNKVFSRENSKLHREVAPCYALTVVGNKKKYYWSFWQCCSCYLKVKRISQIVCSVNFITSAYHAWHWWINFLFSIEGSIVYCHARILKGKETRDVVSDVNFQNEYLVFSLCWTDPGTFGLG